jgi:hypothetical protein
MSQNAVDTEFKYATLLFIHGCDDIFFSREFDLSNEKVNIFIVYFECNCWLSF